VHVCTEGIPPCYMQFQRFLQRAAVFTLTIVVPFTSSAATVTEVLKVKDDANVSRGEFVRAAVSSLGLTLDSKKSSTTYTRPVPKALLPYVNTAQKQGALTVFGKDLSLSKAITRGEAVTVLVQLQKMKPVSRTATFTDVTKGSDMEAAVRVAVEKDWIKPVRSNLFGSARTLTGAEAKKLLKKVTGSSATSIDGNENLPTFTIQVKKREAAELPESELLKTVWQLLNDEYLYQEKIEQKEAGYKAAESLVNSLNDPYTIFMRPVDAQQFNETMEGEISGIGAQVEYKDNALTVIAPISGSPAMEAGIKPGDRITAVDGTSLAGLNLIQAVQKIRGLKGTDVKLSIKRDNNEIEITVTRNIVQMPEIEISFQNDIAIVKLVQFGQKTDRELRDLLKDVQAQNPDGVIIDLRNNPGGLLHAAEIVVSNFVPKGSAVAVIKSKSEEFTEVTVDEPTIKADVPVVVLVNKGSASASEIVAGALQDHKRATIMGEKTFGKGTVQQIVEFRDGSSLKMTIAEWLTPKGRKINGTGVEPDQLVTAGEGRDEVLLRAIDMLR